MGLGQSCQLPKPLLKTADKFPVEVWEKIFEFLPHKDRKAVVLVGRLWRKAGEAPHLWTWVQLPVVLDQKSRVRAIKMLQVSRLARLERIQIDGAETASEDLLQAVIAHTGLKRIDLQRGELSAGSDSQLVIEALTGVERLVLSVPNFPIIDLLTEVSQGGGGTLKEVTLFCNKLDEVPSAIVASALTRLEKVYLGVSWGVSLTSDQVSALMEAINQDDSSLKQLTFVGSLPTQAERTSHLNLRPLLKVEKVELLFNFHTQHELVDFIGALSPSATLRKLSINTRLAEEERLLNLTPLVNLDEVFLGGNFFRHKLVDFFAALSDSTKLKKLSLRCLTWPAEDPMDGSTEVGARAINFLEKVDLAGAYPYQV